MLIGTVLKVMAVTCLLTSAGALSAKAELWKDVDCYCDPKTEARSISGLANDGSNVVGCLCVQYHTLGKLASMEFRFRCKNANANPEMNTWFVRITQQDKPTTCTGVFDSYTDYLSKSCTNWSTLSTDTVQLDLVCQGK